MGDVIDLPDRGKDKREEARNAAEIGQYILDGANDGDLRCYRRYLLRIGASQELIDEAQKASCRQDDLICEIEAQHGEEDLGLPSDWIERRQWLLNHVEELRSRSPLFEEYYWLVCKLDFKKAEEIRQRGLRVVG